MSKSIRRRFSEIFDLRPDGTPVAKDDISIRSTLFAIGTPFPRGFRFGGLDITEHIGETVIVAEYDGMIELKGFDVFPPDLQNPGMVTGWCLFEPLPTLKLKGVYSTRYEAELKKEEFGGDLEIQYGSHKPGTDEFVC